MSASAIIKSSVWESHSGVWFFVFCSAFAAMAVAFFVSKKMKCSRKKMIKSCAYALVIVAVLEWVIYWLGARAGIFVVACKEEMICPTQLQVFWMTTPYTTIPVFSLLVIFCCFVKLMGAKIAELKPVFSHK